MEVVLLENVLGLGKAGDVKQVRDGYARNYLIPYSKAERMTPALQQCLARKTKAFARRVEEIHQEASELKNRLEQEEWRIVMKASEEGKLFGSVTLHHIFDLFKQKGYVISRKSIRLGDRISHTGEYTIDVRLDEGVVAQVQLNIVHEAHARMHAAP